MYQRNVLNVKYMYTCTSTEDNAKCNDFKINVHLVLDNTMYTPERTSEEET